MSEQAILVKRLRAADYWMRGDEGLSFEDDAPFDAADRIEALEAKVVEARKLLKPLVEGFPGYNRDRARIFLETSNDCP